MIRRFIWGLLAVLIAAPALSQTYPLFRPANGILKGQTTTYVTTSAAAADVTAIFSGSCSNVTYLRGDGTCATPPGTGGGTVNSVGLTAPSVFSVSGSPVTSAGVLALTFATGQTQNQVLATPDGSSGAVALRSLVAADLPAVPLATGVSGTLPVANGGTGVATITGPIKGNGTSAFSAAASADIIGLWTGTCSAGTVLKGDGSCAAVGTVTSVGLTVPSGFSVSGSPVTGSGTLGITGTLNPAAGGTGVATITGPIKGNGTSAFSAAASSDMIGLWTGLCSATTYLRGDGSCQTPSGSSVTGANPTALVGLTAVNGASGSFLRADGAPALDQSIAPTWTGVHTFSANPVVNTAIVPDTNAGADVGTIPLIWNTFYGLKLCSSDCATHELITNSGLAVRVANGSIWTSISLTKPTTVTGLLTASNGISMLSSSTLAAPLLFGGAGVIRADNGAGSWAVTNTAGSTTYFSINNLTGAVNTSNFITAAGVLIPRIAYAFVQSGGAITGGGITAVGISSVSGPSPTGTYTVNYNGFFSSPPACTASVSASLAGAKVQVNNAGVNNVVVFTTDNTNASSNQAFNIVCVGPG
jgi:hypothetical protein